MAKDLQAEHPGIQGFSRTSLFAMRQFYLFLSPRFTIVPQAVGQLPWGHIRTILAKIKDVDIAFFMPVHVLKMAGAVQFWIFRSNKIYTSVKVLLQATLKRYCQLLSLNLPSKP